MERCCLCNEPLENEWGNNPDPLNDGKGRCCDRCNKDKVLPARRKEWKIKHPYYEYNDK